MKILFVSGNLCDGGAQRVISVVSSELAEKGHDVNLLLYSRNEKEYPLSEKVKVLSLANNFADYQKISGLKRIKLIRKVLKEVKPEVAVGFLEGGYGLYLSSFGLKMKKVSSARINPKYIIEKKGLKAFINKIWFKKSHAIVLQTESQREFAPKSWQKKSVVIANPVSEIALSNEKQSHNDNCKNIIMVGRLDDQKNYSMAIEAIRILRDEYPDIHLDVFGKGWYEETIKKEIEEKDLEDYITLKGWTQNAAQELKEHDLYLMTSDFEGMPNALMEAMVVGLPVISTDCPTGPSDLIDNGVNGYLVPIGDAKVLAERIKEVIEMPKEKRIEMAKLARQKMQENFNNKAITAKWEELFKSLIKKD